MNIQRCDKSMRNCVTCRYWSGYREFDGIGGFSFDTDNKSGKCCNVGWKGFSGATTDAYNFCQDYESQY